MVDFIRRSFDSGLDPFAKKNRESAANILKESGYHVIQSRYSMVHDVVYTLVADKPEENIQGNQGQLTPITRPCLQNGGETSSSSEGASHIPSHYGLTSSVTSPRPFSPSENGEGGEL